MPQLTGELVYRAFVFGVSHRVPATPTKRWLELTDGGRALYEGMAAWLNSLLEEAEGIERLEQITDSEAEQVS